MARTFNTIGVTGDLSLGGGNIQADYRWVGEFGDGRAPTTPGTGNADSVSYPRGTVVVHNDLVWIAVGNNVDNIEPGGTMSNGNWEALGESNVISVWNARAAYEQGSLVYYRGTAGTGPALLYYALQNIDAPANAQADPNDAPDMDDTNWLPVGGTSIDPQAPITYNEDTGALGIALDDNSLEENSGSLRLKIDGNSLQAQAAGVSVQHDESLRVTTSGLGANLRPDSEGDGNDIELDTSDSDNGLYVSSYDLEVQTYSGTLDDGDNATAADINLTGGRDTDRDITIIADRIAAATSSTPTSLRVSRNSEHSLRIEGPPVASWAQTQTGLAGQAHTIIPLSKLPNLQLGNTHTFASDGDPAENEIRDAVVANNGGEEGGTAGTPLEWHPGDLLVISGTAPDNANNGIFVYVGEDQSGVSGGVSPLRTNGMNNGPRPTTAEQRATAFAANFRAVISADTEVQTSLNSFSVADGGTGTRTTMSQGSLNSVGYSSTNDQIEFVGSGGTLTIPQSERIADSEAGGDNPSRPPQAFINNIKIGNTIYRFGAEPPLPRLSLTANPASNEILLYRSNAQSVDYNLVVRQEQRTDAGTLVDGDRTASVSGISYAASDLTDVRGPGRTFDTSTGTFTIPASGAPGFITTPGTITLGSSDDAPSGLTGVPVNLAATEITHVYRGPRAGTTDTRTAINSEAYASGTTIAWDRVDATSYTITVDGADSERLQDDIVSTFDDAHAGLFIDAIGDGDDRIQVPGSGTFTTTLGTEASNGMERPGLTLITSVPDTAGSTLESADGVSLPILASTTLTRFYTAQRDGTGTRTAIGDGNYNNVMVRAAQGDNIAGTANNNNDVIIELTGDDAADAQADLQTWLADTTNTGRLFFGLTTTNSVRRDDTGGRLTEDQTGRVAYRAANERVAYENVQTDTSISLEIDGNATMIPDATVPAVVYNSVTNSNISPGELDLEWEDRRAVPTIGNPNSGITIFHTDPINYSTDLNNSDGEIANGRGYDVQGYTVAVAGGNAGTVSTVNPHPQAISTALFGTAATGNNPTTSNNVVFAFPMQPDNVRRNLQPNTSPPSVTRTVTIRRPWGWILSPFNTAPTAGDIRTALMSSNSINEIGREGYTGRDVNNVSISGTTGRQIWLVAPASDVGVTMQDIDSSGDIQLVNARTGGTSGANLISIIPVTTSQSGVTVDYAVFRTAAGLVASPTVFNIDVI